MSEPTRYVPASSWQTGPPAHEPWPEPDEAWDDPEPYQPRHAAVAPPKLEPTGEPVVIAHAVTVILGAVVTAGWVVIPDARITAIGTVVALVLSTVAAVMARARVSPVKGGIWGAIGGYVADVVRAELDKYPG